MVPPKIPGLIEVRYAIEMFRGNYYAEGGIRDKLNRGEQRESFRDLANLKLYLDLSPEQWVLKIPFGVRFKDELDLLVERLMNHQPISQKHIFEFEDYLDKTGLPPKLTSRRGK